METLRAFISRSGLALDPGHPRHTRPEIPPAEPLRPLLLVHLKGSEGEMGAQHGELARSLGRTRALADFYPRMAQRLILGHLPAPFRTRLADWIADRVFGRLIARMDRSRPPHLKARTEAFCRAAGSGEELAHGFLATDLFENMVALASRAGLVGGGRNRGATVVPSCSTAMVWGESSRGGCLRHARNFDFLGVGLWDRAPSVVFCDPPGGLRYGFVTTWGADIPGVTAFNEAGIVLTVHTRFHRDVTFDGVGVVDYGHEIIRRARSLAEAIEIARTLPVMSAWGVAISSASERCAVVVETSGRAMEIVHPKGDRPCLTCANRYHSAAMQAGEVAGAPSWMVHSIAREQRMHDLIAAGVEKGGLSSDDLEALLGDHRDPADPLHERSCGDILSQPCTVNSIVADGEHGEIRVSVGPCPTGWGPYLRIPWSWGARGYQLVDATSCDPALVGRSVRPDFADGVEEQAYQQYLEACRIDGLDRFNAGIRERIEAAVSLAPDDPSYRFLAGILGLRAGDAHEALVHLHSGLEVETATFRRGQLLLWGSRAADLYGRHRCATAMRAELEETDHPYLVWHRRLARREEVRSFPAWRSRLITPNLLLVDAD